MNRINICLVTEEFRPSLKGGIATWSTELANYLDKQNFNLTVFLKKRGGINKSFNINNLPYKINLINGRDWAYFKKWYVKRAIYSYLRSHKKPVIISTNWELSQGITCFKKYFKFSLITIMHGLEVSRLESQKYKKKIKSFNSVISLSDKVISVSNYTKNKAKSILFRYKEIDVIPNFVNINSFYPINNKNLRKDYNLSSNDIVILSLSRLTERKGHLISIDAVKYLTKKYSNIKYLIAGTGDRTYEKKLKAYVKKYNLDNCIYFLGYVNENLKNEIYNLCDIYIMTSLPSDIYGSSEGFGITFLEANACGKPVIGTDVGGISDAIKNGFNGFLIKPNDSKELEKILISIINNKKLYKSLSENSIYHIKKNFDINVIGKRFDAIIDELYDSL